MKNSVHNKQKKKNNKCEKFSSSKCTTMMMYTEMYG